MIMRVEQMHIAITLTKRKRCVMPHGTGKAGISILRAGEGERA